MPINFKELKFDTFFWTKLIIGINYLIDIIIHMKIKLLIAFFFVCALSFANLSPLKLDLTKGDVRKALVESNMAHGYTLIAAYNNDEGKLVMVFSNGTDGKRFISTN